MLVIDVPDTESGSKTLAAFRTSLEERMQDVLARDVLVVPVGDLPRAGETMHPSIALSVPARTAVRRQLGLEGADAELVLIGKDGGVKARQSGEVFDLARILAQIDAMPMRRAERRQP